MHIPTSISEALGRIAFEFTNIQPFLPTYLHLILSALFPIYAGSHSSLSRPSSAAKRTKRKEKDHDDGLVDEEEDAVQKMEGLSPSDAIVFPILAGCTLAGLYFLIKWLQDPALLNKILNWYFATFSIFSVSRLVSDGLDVVHSLAFPHEHVDAGHLFHVDYRNKRAVPVDTSVKASRTSPLPGPFSRLPLPKRIVDILWMLHVAPNRKLTFDILLRRIFHVNIKLGVHGIEGLLAGTACVIYYNFIGKPWFLTNLMGFGFAYGALQLLSPTTFWTGNLILVALFFYDIYFVFYTPMMVSVAKSLDIPVKLLFPSPAPPDAEDQAPRLSMLGLGDVVLPGILIGLALRFDLYMYYLKKQRKVPGKQPEVDQESGRTTEVTGNATADDTANPKPDAVERADTSIIKAPYVTVGEGWGDALWTSPLLARLLSPLSPLPSEITKSGTYKPRNSFPKPYFNAALFGYVTGMVVTLAAMQISDHPQPALLYLVPGVTGSLWLQGCWRGEVREMWHFSDADEEEEANQKDKAKDKKDKDGVKEAAKSGSFFSMERSDERAQRLEKALGKHVSTKKPNKDQLKGDGDEASSKEEEGQKNKEDATLFSFTVTLPPPMWSKNKHAASVQRHESSEDTAETTSTTVEKPSEGDVSHRFTKKQNGPGDEHQDKKVRVE